MVTSSSLFKEWNRNAYLDYLHVADKKYLAFIEENPIADFSLEKIVQSYLIDLPVLSKDERLHYIHAIIDRLSLQHLASIIQKYSINITKNNEYDCVAEYFSEEIDQFLLFFDIRVIQVKSEEKKQSSISTIYPMYPLRDYQKRCCESLDELRATGEKKALLHLPTGAGKTRTAITYCCEYLKNKPNSLVVWFADTQELCEQALQEFQKAWSILGNRELSCGAYFGLYDFSLGSLHDGFIVAGLHKFRIRSQSEKIYIQKRLAEFTSKVSFVVFDEAHKAVAPTYSVLVNSLTEEKDTFLLGLTATPGRSVDDKEANKKLSEFFDNNKVDMHVPGYSSPLEYLRTKKYLASPTFQTVNYDTGDIDFFRFSLEKMDDFIENVLANDLNRNLAIVQNIMNHFESTPTSQAIVFACSIEHSRELSFWLNGMGFVAKVIDSNTPYNLRNYYIEQYKFGTIQLLINFNVLTAGFDAPCTDAVFITRPTNSLVQYVQMAGRAMRGVNSGGHDKCHIYTVNDNIEEFQNMFKAFDFWNDNWSK